MLELVFTACLLSGDQSCKTIHVPLDKEDTMITCQRTGHDKALEWQAENERYMVVGWHCKDNSKTPTAGEADSEK